MFVYGSQLLQMHVVRFYVKLSPPMTQKVSEECPNRHYCDYTESLPPSMSRIGSAFFSSAWPKATIAIFARFHSTCILSPWSSYLMSTWGKSNLVSSYFCMRGRGIVVHKCKTGQPCSLTALWCEMKCLASPSAESKSNGIAQTRRSNLGIAA